MNSLRRIDLKTEIYDVVVDSYAWVEYFLGSESGEVVKNYLKNASAIYTPSIVLAELARKYLREGVDIKEIRRRLLFISEVSIIVDIDLELSLEAAISYRVLTEHAKRWGINSKPSLVDAVILAVSRLKNAKILTGDIHFKELRHTIWIGASK